MELERGWIGLGESKKQSRGLIGSLVTHSCPTLCDPVDCSMPGLPVHHQLLELAQTHVHYVADATQPFYPLSSPSPPAFSLSQHQGLFQWVSLEIYIYNLRACSHGGQQIAAWTSGLVCLCQPEGARDISQNEQCWPQRTSKKKHLRKAFQAGGIAYAKALNLEAGWSYLGTWR